MARLYRPSIPLFVKCQVLIRQLEYDDLSAKIMLAVHQRKYGALVENLLGRLAGKLGCERSELRLDHDPALGMRKKRGEGKNTVYAPNANDPAFLRYRPHGAQHEGSHDVKTRIRGDHGQYSDVVLIKRQRRRERALDEAVKKKRPDLRKSSAHSGTHKPKTKWAKRTFPKGQGFQRRK